MRLIQPTLQPHYLHPTSTLADTKHTGGDDSPTAVFLTAQTTSYPCASSTDRFETPASPEAADDGYDELDPSVQAAINQEYINSLSLREARNCHCSGGLGNVLVLDYLVLLLVYLPWQR